MLRKNHRNHSRKSWTNAKHKTECGLARLKAGVSWTVAGPQQTSSKHLNNWSVGTDRESDTDTATDTDTDTIGASWATNFLVFFCFDIATTFLRLRKAWQIESNRIEWKRNVWSAHKSGLEFVGLWPMPIELAQSPKQMSNWIPVGNKKCRRRTYVTAKP